MMIPLVVVVVVVVVVPVVGGVVVVVVVGEVVVAAAPAVRWLEVVAAPAVRWLEVVAAPAVRWLAVAVELTLLGILSSIADDLAFPLRVEVVEGVEVGDGWMSFEANSGEGRQRAEDWGARFHSPKYLNLDSRLMQSRDERPACLLSDP